MGGHSSELFQGTSGIAANSSKAEVSSDTIPNSAGSIAPSKAGDIRKRLLDEATTPEARRIVGELYRQNAETGDGGTADAIREQLRSGELIGGKDHIRKGRERLRQIERLLSKNPNHPDKALLEKLKNDLKNALGGK